MAGPISVLDMFKIGVGPSSSHTLGPWRAGLEFRKLLISQRGDVEHLAFDLHGSLAKTGRGHGTDVAVMLGLLGEDPVTCDVGAIDSQVERIRREGLLRISDELSLRFDASADIRFFGECLPFHPNGLIFRATISGAPLESTYYSIGGGFIVREGEEERSSTDGPALPHPIVRADELQRWCSITGLSIAQVVERNEAAWRPESETHDEVARIWRVMQSCMYRGCHTAGVLPGGLGVTRRAASINRRLIGTTTYDGFDEWIARVRDSAVDFASTLDWVSCFALAVNEENASFGRVVTAPTNGAAGVIPAVLQYMVVFRRKDSPEAVREFLYTAAEIGSIFKKSSTISAAMGGCQAEIGVSSSMAAAGLVACLGGTPEQCLMAAEIAMEHHLGMTCDPIGGLVQVPCIERNAMGAIKAITAAQLALTGDPSEARVSLDIVVRTMWETALDMNDKYKETADGGLAAMIPLGLSEC